MIYENIVIGKPIVSEIDMFALDENDWERLEKEKTLYTNERFLPKVMVEAGIVKSVNEVRRNKKEFVRRLNGLEYLEIKWGKRKLFILVGEKNL